MATAELTLVSQDGNKFQISADFANLSEHVKNIIEDSSLEELIPMPRVDSKTWELIETYAEHHNFIPPNRIKVPLESNVISDVVDDDWDAEFISNIDEDRLLDLIMASNYLHMESLFSLCCAMVACLFKGKEVPEAMALVNIPGVELTPAEEEWVKAEYPWALEDGGNKTS